MSLVEVLELRILLDEITNLDLLRKGLYRVRVSVRCGGQDPGPTGHGRNSSSDGIAAVPFSCSAQPTRLQSISRGVECPMSELGAHAGAIDDENGFYVSRSVYMRYSDERFELNEAVTFRLEAPITVQLSSHMLHDDSRSEAASNDAAHSGSGNSDGRQVPHHHRAGLTWTISLELMRADCQLVSDDSATSVHQHASSAEQHGMSVQTSYVRQSVRRTSDFNTVSTRSVTIPHASLRRGFRNHSLSGSSSNASFPGAYYPICWDIMNLACLGVTLSSCSITAKFERFAPPVPPPSIIKTTPGVPHQQHHRHAAVSSTASADTNSRITASSSSSAMPLGTEDQSNVGSALLRWAGGFRSGSTLQVHDSAAASTGTAKSNKSDHAGTTNHSAFSTFKQLAATVSAGVASAAIGFASAITAPPSAFTRTSSSSGTMDVDSRESYLPTDVRSFLVSLEEHDAAPQTLAELCFPGHHHLQSVNRAARTDQLIDQLVHLEACRDAEITASSNDMINAADIEQLSVQFDFAETRVHDSIASLTEGCVAHKGGVNDNSREMRVSAAEAQSAHRSLVRPLLDTYRALHHSLEHLQSRAAKGEEAETIALELPLLHTYAPSRFGPPVVMRLRNGSHGVDRSAAENEDASLRELFGSLPRYHSDGRLIPFDASELLIPFDGHDADPERVADGFGVPGGTLIFNSSTTAQPLSFASRASDALQDPEAVARALMHEVQHVSSGIYGLWHALQRISTKLSRTIASDLQAQYRRVAQSHVSAAMTRYRGPEFGLVDARAVDPDPIVDAHEHAARALSGHGHHTSGNGRSFIMHDFDRPASAAYVLDSVVMAVPDAIKVSITIFTNDLSAGAVSLPPGAPAVSKPITAPSSRRNSMTDISVKRPHSRMSGILAQTPTPSPGRDYGVSVPSGSGAVDGGGVTPPTPPSVALTVSKMAMFAPMTVAAGPADGIKSVARAAAAAGDDGTDDGTLTVARDSSGSDLRLHVPHPIGNRRHHSTGSSSGSSSSESRRELRSPGHLPSAAAIQHESAWTRQQALRSERADSVGVGAADVVSSTLTAVTAPDSISFYAVSSPPVSATAQHSAECRSPGAADEPDSDDQSMPSQRHIGLEEATPTSSAIDSDDAIAGYTPAADDEGGPSPVPDQKYLLQLQAAAKRRGSMPLGCGIAASTDQRNAAAAVRFIGGGTDSTSADAAAPAEAGLGLAATTQSALSQPVNEAAACTSTATARGRRSSVPHAAHAPSSAASQGTHVVVFLNGLSGSVYDTRTLRAHLKLQYPHLLCYVTTTNQGKQTEGDIIDSAARIAHEIHSFICDRMTEDGLVLEKLSVIAFSLGGVVARLALRHPLLQPYLPHAHAFISVASPHLGLQYSGSVISTGLFLLRQLRSSVSMAQLSLLDEPAGSSSSGRGVRDCLLFLLACGWDDRGRGGVRSSSGLDALTAPTAHGATFARLTRALSPENSGLSTGSASRVATGANFAAAQRSRTTSNASTGSWVDVNSQAQVPTSSILREDDVALPPSGAPSPSSATSTTLASLRRHGFASVPNGSLLNNFKHVCLLASQQDSYAPFASCMAQVCEPALQDTKNGSAYVEMSRGFYAGCDPSIIQKVEVAFNSLPGSTKLTVDGMIGREAHVAFLECEQVAAALALGMGSIWDLD